MMVLAIVIGKAAVLQAAPNGSAPEEQIRNIRLLVVLVKKVTTGPGPTKSGARGEWSVIIFSGKLQRRNCPTRSQVPPLKG